MTRNISLTLLTMVGIETAAQENNNLKAFNLHGQVFELFLEDSSEKPLMDVPIEIWCGDELITKLESGPKGKYSVNLTYYPKYQIKFGKAPYVSKIVEIDAKGFSRSAEFGIVNLDLDISIFKDENFMGMDFMNFTPVAKLYFNKSKGVIVWDDQYCDQMNARMCGILQANGKVYKPKKKK
ncbi:MAG: hypothetical protein ACKVOR_12130 [Flavobacteriales bacterium]